MSPEEIDLLSSPDSIRFLIDHAHDDPALLALKTGAKVDAALTRQLALRQKAAGKFPTFLNTPGFIFPAARNIEQSSSEETAQFKASLIPDAKVIVDLSGGMGTDAYYFSKVAGEVVLVEPDAALCEIVQHNMNVLAVKNITVVNATAESYLSAVPQDAFVYLDPSRRDNQGKRVTGLAAYSPDPSLILHELKGRINGWMVKVSPMEDIDATADALKEVGDVWIVSRKNEVRELLFTGPHEGDYRINCRGIQPDLHFSFTKDEEKNAPVGTGDPSGHQFLYDPFSAILKSGGFKLLGLSTGTIRPDPSTHLYFSKDLIGTFPGRQFRVIDFISPGELKTFCKKHGNRFNVSIKNYPERAETISKKLGLKPDDKNHLWFFTAAGQRRVAVCERIGIL